nr:MAG TPA: hypothetical protein [Bacteriophage sp.]
MHIAENTFSTVLSSQPATHTSVRISAAVSYTLPKTSLSAVILRASLL